MDVAQKTKKQDKNENLLIDKNCFLRINPKLKAMVREEILLNHGFLRIIVFFTGLSFR